MANNRPQARVTPGVVGQTVTIPVSLRVESYPSSASPPVPSRDEELRELRGALHGVREELRQVKLTVAELVRITYESVARLDSLMAPARLGTHLMEAMHRPPTSDGPRGAPVRDAATAPQRSGRGGNAARGQWQQRTAAGGRPAPAKTQKKKPVPSAEVLSDLSAKQDGDPVVSLVKKAVSAGQELTRQERETWPKESQLLMRQWSRLELWNGVLYRRACVNNGSPPVRQLVTSSQSLRGHMQAAHRKMGHCGAERLLEWARGQLFSPGLAAQIDELIRQCEKCGAAGQKGRPATTTAAAGEGESPPTQDPATETAGDEGERGRPSVSPEVYALAPDQDPELDPDTILLSQHSGSSGSSPELSPTEKVPEADQQREPQSSPPPPPPPASSRIADPSLTETAGLCRHQESPEGGTTIEA